ncbi:MAG: type IV pilus modification protein PilV [Burkholderiales bacterium]
MMRRLQHRVPATGFTLVEVMVAIVILSFGLLGVAGLMVLGIQNTYSSQQRSTATQLAYDMIDRMRSNQAGVALDTLGTATNGYNRPSNDVAVDPLYTTQAAGCLNTSGPAVGTCTAAELASQDAFEWQQAIRTRLGNGVGIVCRDTSTNDGSYNGTTITHACSQSGHMYAVKIFWRDDRSSSNTNNTFQVFATRFLP